MQHPFCGARLATGRTTTIIAVCAGLLALALRLYFVTHAQVLQAVNEESVRADAAQYYHYAWNLVHRGVFSSAMPSASAATPDSFRDPGYPLFLALAMKLTNSFGTFYAFILLAQAALGAATVSILTVAARHWLPRWGLAAAAALMAVWPHSVSIPAYLLTETLVGFLSAVALLVTDLASRRSKTAAWGIAGVAWSLAGMTNAVLLPLAVVLAIILWLRHKVEHRAVLALALASLVLPVAWGIRSTSLPSEASSTTRAVTNLVQGSWPSYHVAYQRALKGDPEGAQQLQSMQVEMDTLQGDPSAGLSVMRARMGQHPMAYMQWYAWKPALLWAWDIRVGQGDIYIYPTRNSPFFATGTLQPLEALCYVANPAIMALMLIGVLLGLIRRNATVVSSGAAILVLFVTLIYSALQSEPRYSIPFRGMEMLLAVGGAAGLINWIGGLRRTTAQP
jgi:hypothetical protein